MVVDGETLRARVRAAEIQGRLEDMVIVRMMMMMTVPIMMITCILGG